MMERLAQLDPKHAAVASLVLAVFYFFMVFDDGSQVVASIAQTEQTIAETERLIDKHNRLIADAAQYRTLLARFGAELKKTSDYLPESLSGIDLMRIVSNEAKAAGVSIERVNHSGAEATSWPFIQEIGVETELKGSFHQLMAFLAALTRTGRIITMKKVTLSSQSSGGPVSQGGPNLLTFVGKMSGYRYTPKASAESAAPQGE